MKELDYVMNTMASRKTLYELEVTETRRDIIDSSETKDTNQFTYRKSFVIHFMYRHQVNDHNIRIYVPISLERIWATKFWPDFNCFCYLTVLEVITDLASGHFQNNEVVPPSLDFWRALEIKCLENRTGI